MQKENSYQARLIQKIHVRFPGCFVMKNDPSYIQGIPDLTILYNDKWAVLEVKRSPNEIHRPNQDYYIEELNAMSFAAFIYPENEEEVLDGLQRALEPSRSTRRSQR